MVRVPPPEQRPDPAAAAPRSSRPQPRDRHGRPLGVLRLSLTARCNLACPYCLPDGQEPPGLLSLNERLALVQAGVALGVRSLRLTGGEPLLHRGLEELIAAVQPLRQRGLQEVALTSNGTLLTARRAHALKRAGLDRITLSLDGATGSSVAMMAGLADAAAGERALQQVLAAIEHARAAGFDPARGALKLNAVIQPGRNDDQLLPLAALARDRGLELRLIEFMDVGNRNGWRPQAVLSAAAMIERIGAQWPLERLGRPSHGTASRWRYRDGAGLTNGGAELASGGINGGTNSDSREGSSRSDGSSCSDGTSWSGGGGIHGDSCGSTNSGANSGNNHDENRGAGGDNGSTSTSSSRSSSSSNSGSRSSSGGAHLAVVASVSEPFCGDCNRLRITADGCAYTCLFADPSSGLDLRPWLQPGTPAGALEQAMATLWQGRQDRWSEERQTAWQQGKPPPLRHAEMAYLGG